LTRLIFKSSVHLTVTTGSLKISVLRLFQRLLHINFTKSDAQTSQCRLCHSVFKGGSQIEKNLFPKMSLLGRSNFEINEWTFLSVCGRGVEWKHKVG